MKFITRPLMKSVWVQLIIIQYTVSSLPTSITLSCSYCLRFYIYSIILLLFSPHYYLFSFYWFQIPNGSCQRRKRFFLSLGFICFDSNENWTSGEAHHIKMENQKIIAGQYKVDLGMPITTQNENATVKEPLTCETRADCWLIFDD